MFDQRGCLSLHWVFTDAELPPFMTALEKELSVMADTMPAGAAMSRDFPSVQAARALTAMRPQSYASSGPAERGTVLASRLPALAAHDALEPSPGGRSVRLYRVPSLADVDGWRQRLEPWRGKLQGLALEEGRQDLAPVRELARQLGVSYLCRAGELQEVEADWPNGGYDPLVVYGLE